MQYHKNLCFDDADNALQSNLDNNSYHDVIHWIFVVFKLVSIVMGQFVIVCSSTIMTL